jgi:5-bromo-4-chloroindolyl phosphate hydrolysis protein
MPLIIALIFGIVLFVILLKVLLFIGALVIGLALAVFVYFAAEKLVGQGR